MKTQAVTLEVIKDELIRLEKRMDRKFEEQDEKAREYRDDIFNKIDGLMSELENHRLERLDLKNNVNNLDKRMAKLEHHSKVL